jgi:hypothetical protein
VRKKPSDTCFHKHTLTAPTLNHAGHVDKNSYLTLKQAQKNNPTAQQSLLHLQSCGNSKTAPAT